MSHLPERKEKICLNCRSVVYGRFCHVCGQENTEPKETFRGLITHFIYDITHFDGKFFDTTRHLLLRPGYLAYEYLRGRRAAYLNPVRMYVFTSAFFFILFFSFLRDISSNDRAVVRITEGDSLNYRPFENPDLPWTVREYDSLQHSLPASERQNWFGNMITRKMISVNERYGNNGKQFWNDANEKFTHSVPQMMFVSLPLVALVLQLLYYRRKQYYYANHVIFTINLYIAVYLLLLVFYAFEGLYTVTGSNIFQVLRSVIMLLIFFYTYKAMRNFYQQRRAKTVFKFMVFLVSFMILMLLLMAIFFLTSALQI
jgi:hypothetical protein